MTPSRRDFLALSIRSAALVALGGGAAALATRRSHDGGLWQIDPAKCIACGKCATSCVLKPSAARCFHTFEMCGYCNLCTGYFQPDADTGAAGAEAQVCPTGAILRKSLTPPYYEYAIDQAACIGCAKCVDGCASYGNGSLHMQISQDLCKRCNVCAIASDCPSGAISRVGSANAYKRRG